ncbi:hypothetical protein GIB67_004590 [Kingdonia uniflora]|uniref:Polygalacturonase n=1 Tax=Kingdonia uniflora TaxID=39325 RepID=A0A7J7MD09_9MAGN|nr:hypothetical protein GIB67_004590 [Kingdonia uniflora]
MRGRRAEVKVLVPKGDYGMGPVVFEGPCKASTIHFELQGTLKASTDLSKFKKDGWISFYRITGFKLSGGGVFDGQGASTWSKNSCSKQKNCNVLPVNIRFDYITNGHVSYVSSINSKMFHINILGCNDITLDHVTVTAPGESPNTDGIHLGDSTKVTITNCIIATGDDCVSIGSGSSHVIVDKVTCGPGHGISIGSLGRYPDEKDVTDITVTRIILKGTTNGVRIKTWQESPKETKVTNVIFKDITMQDVQFPLNIDQEYCPYASCGTKSPSKVKITNVQFNNIRGTSASKDAVKIVCSKGMPCEGVKLGDINLTYNGAQPTSICRSAHISAVGKVFPVSCST